VIYVPVMQAEAETLRKLFAAEYDRYSQQVPWFPRRLSPYRRALSRPTQFDVALYMRHREYRAAVGFVVAYGLLAAKLVLV